MSIDYDQNFKATLIKKNQINHDVFMFGFESETNMQLLPAEHFKIIMKDSEGQHIARSYTPILSQQHYFEVPIKIYKNGEMTQILSKLPLNTNITLQRRLGKIAYSGMGRFIINPKLNRQFKIFSTLLMVCGGTGITPAYSLIQHILNQPTDSTKLNLLFANKTPNDNFLSQQLLRLSKEHQNRFTYNEIYETEKSQSGYIGYVTRDILRDVCPQTNEEVLATYCGPKAMNQALATLLKEQGFTSIIKY